MINDYNITNLAFFVSGSFDLRVPSPVKTGVTLQYDTSH